VCCVEFERFTNVGNEFSHHVFLFLFYGYFMLIYCINYSNDGLADIDFETNVYVY